MSSTTRRLAAAIGTACTSAVLAAMLTTGTAVAQSAPGPNSAACEAAKARVTELQGDLTAAQRAADEIRSEAAETNLPAADPDASQDDSEGDPTGLDGPLDRPETDGSDEVDGADDVPEGDEPAGVPLDADDVPETDGSDTQETDGSDSSEGAPLDTNEAPVDPDGPDGISPAEQREIDRAVRVVNRVQRNLDNAEARRDKVCATPTTSPATPAVTPAGSVVVCVLKPGVCAEVRVDSQGRLVEIVREHQCKTDGLPVSASSKGAKVTTVSRQVIERHVTSDPGSGSTTTYLPSDPGSSSTFSGGQVTQVPSGAVDTGDGTALS